MTSSDLLIHADRHPLDLAVAAWLEAKRTRSGSAGTVQAYRATLQTFRAALQARGLDLDGDPHQLSLVAQAIASTSWTQPGQPVAPATQNRRLAALSSFYIFALKRGFLNGANPIAVIERAHTQPYARVKALDFVTLQARLKQIDRITLLGMRDYALLAVALFTGRRLAEIAGLYWADLEHREPRVTLTFPRCKGGTQMRDTLPPVVATALLRYRDELQTAGEAVSAEAPLWPRLDRAAPPCAEGSVRQPLSAQAIADLCQRRLGVRTVHTLRHSFAKAMEAVGAPPSEIQRRLGHRSLSVTSLYLAALRSDENVYGEQVVALLGLE